MNQPGTGQAESNENRILAALGYPIWIVALVVMLTDMKKNPFMRLHAVQALGYTIAWVVVYTAKCLKTIITERRSGASKDPLPGVRRQRGSSQCARIRRIPSPPLPVGLTLRQESPLG